MFPAVLGVSTGQRELQSQKAGMCIMPQGLCQMLSTLLGLNFHCLASWWVGGNLDGGWVIGGGGDGLKMDEWVGGHLTWQVEP